MVSIFKNVKCAKKGERHKGALFRLFYPLVGKISAFDFITKRELMKSGGV